jgi:hypothetical protein
MFTRTTFESNSLSNYRNYGDRSETNSNTADLNCYYNFSLNFSSDIYTVIECTSLSCLDPYSYVSKSK